jgi:aminopeptidase N
MIVASDERRHAWMDEGFNTFMNFYSETNFYGATSTFKAPEISSQIAAQMQMPVADQPILNYPDGIRRSGLGLLAYFKPGYGLVLLREVILGPERFDMAFREYIQRWKYKHPSPADFYRTMENVAGEDLSWFWRGWFESTATLDQSILSVVSNEGLTEIRLQNKGKLIMPVPLEITLKNGTKVKKMLPADIWRTSDVYNYALELKDQAVEVILDPDGWLPDVSKTDNRWTQKKD